MPVRKDNFTITYDKLSQVVDVDALDGRDVPINMNFTDVDYLTKDTGSIFLGQTQTELCHSIFYYKKKSGLGYLIRAKGTKLQRYNFLDRTWSDITGSPTFTAGKEFGYVVYDDLLYLGNGTESLYTFNGLTFTEYASAPKGNILEVFEDKLFISGVTAEPLTVYYSNTGALTTFTSTDVLKPIGTDYVTNLKTYYGALLIFKRNSIWKLSFQYDPVVTLFLPKLESQTQSYGACSRKAVSWVENDLWFFTGTEVRSIGYQDNITGVLGVNRSVISEQIKETVQQVENYDKCMIAYSSRRVYLGVPINSTTNNVTFVCHLLYNRTWTKYEDRSKGRIHDMVFVDDDTYSSHAESPYGTVKWNVTAEDSQSITNTFTTE